MPDSPDDIMWHPAFYGAAELELQENINELEIIPEYNLSKEPIRIDLLITKNKNKATSIKNEIGHIMRTYNIIEYKSPDDGMTVDDFYKTLGYACLYKGYGESVNQIPIDEITISLFREVYPREMFKELEKSGLEISEQYPGIYYVTGNIPVPAQVIVTSRLSPENHSSLRILSVNADKADVERFLRYARLLSNQGDRNNVDAVLQASVSANFELYEEVRRNSVMCEALQELMKDEINEKINEAKTEGGIESKLEDVKNIMETMELSIEQAMDALKIPTSQREMILKKLN